MPRKLTKAQAAERDASIAYLCDVLPPGTRVYTKLISVSRSGMSRVISVHVVIDGVIVNITHHVARAIDYTLTKSGPIGLKVPGCGMDMGYHVVHNLSYALHGMTDKPLGAIKPHASAPCETAPETPYRAGYTLRQEWL